MTPAEIAEWMLAEVRRIEVLDHPAVIGKLLEVAPGLVNYNDVGNPVLAKSILKAFGKREGDDIVWSRSELHWRLRQHGDLPGRLVD